MAVATTATVYELVTGGRNHSNYMTSHSMTLSSFVLLKDRVTNLNQPDLGLAAKKLKNWNIFFICGLLIFFALNSHEKEFSSKCAVANTRQEPLERSVSSTSKYYKQVYHQRTQVQTS